MAQVRPADQEPAAGYAAQGHASHVREQVVACAHVGFETQVRTRPDAIAVDDGHTQLSYGELNIRANRLAHHLRALGAGPDRRVALCLERGIDMVVCVLATWKAGSAYVPLDPAYPRERLEFMLRDSAPVALLTQASQVADWRHAADGVPIIDVTSASQFERDAGDADVTCAESGVTPQHLAYVIYTSGSTGTPKGVMVEHHSLVNLHAALDDAVFDATGHHARVALNASLSFDASLQSLTQLLSGRCVVTVPEHVRGDGVAMLAFLQSQRIDAFDCTPAQMELLLAAGFLTRHAYRPQAVLVGGEAIGAKTWQTLAAATDVRFFNAYGPTECTVDATLARIEGDAAPHIGRAISNAIVYILDGNRIRVAAGEEGEIHIAGAGVARGYLDRDGLTSERFIADPFDGTPGARMYRTGDLGCWRDDGTIEYVGRNDFQVKVHGFRIELGEIEACLVEHAGVREAKVLVREDVAGQKRLVAYWVADAGQAVDVESLRAHAARRLPDYMVPVMFVGMDAMPLTPNGKIDRDALPAPGRDRPPLAVTFEPPANSFERTVCDVFDEILAIDGVGRHDNFFELGGNSILAVRFIARLAQRTTQVSADCPVTTLFQHPTAAALVDALTHEPAAEALAERIARPRRIAESADDVIAIVAMAGRFPGANDVEAFWDNLCQGRDSITRFARDELDASVSAADRADPNYIAARGVIEGVEMFDAGFFGISPREAELMDPQQRIFLELCWECIERGGYAPDSIAAPVGVFAGMNNGTYFQRHVSAHPEAVAKLGEFQVMVGNEKDYIATRVAHKLNLTGPAVSVNTACSTSLVAICQAVDSLRAGQCDMALAGGVAVTCPSRSGYRYQEGSMLSPDGHTRPFGSDAQGTVFNDGAAIVLLKRLSDALADGDQVHAVIRGGAINNDGGHKASFTAPSADGQAAVIAMAHRAARVEPRSIGYVEAHGTATPLGDPIEIEGLTKAFRLGTDDTGFCRVGSVKSNVGHLVTAAGATGLIKAALSLREKLLPPTLYFSAPNPAIEFARTPFVVNSTMQPWSHEGDTPRRAGVSSFGVGGTNAHVVLEEAPPLPASDASDGPVVLGLSARTPGALAETVARLAGHLARNPDVNLADAAWTLAVGRKAFAHRVTVTASTVADAVERLKSTDTAVAIRQSKPARTGDVVFLFPGQGCQYAGMGRELHAAEPAFRAAFDACADAARDVLPFDLRGVVFGEDAEALLPTGVMQPAIFAVEYSLARLWMSYGVQPAAMIGHSIGEFVAATLAGIFNLDDAMRLVARRGALMQAQPTGAMLSVRLSADEVRTRLPAALSLAAENAPGACVVSGPHADIEAFRVSLEAGDIACRLLKTSHAFHSSMMDAVIEPFRDAVAALDMRPPTLSIVSTATGDWLGAKDAVSPDYWARHLREPVRFASALGCVIDAPARSLLEVGPRGTLSGLVKQRIGGKPHLAAVASLGAATSDEVGAFRAAAGRLWTQGSLDSLDVFDRRQRRHRLCLPTYPFERSRYWLEATPAIATTATSAPTSILHVLPAAIAVPVQETAMPAARPVSMVPDRRSRLLGELKAVFEDIAGFDLADADEASNFIELGLDSLNLTQVALQLQKTFAIKITFRQLMADVSSLGALADLLDEQMPVEPGAAPAAVPAAMQAAPSNALPTPFAGLALISGAVAMNDSQQGLVHQVIQQQMQVMAQQLAMLSGLQSGSPAMPSMPVQLAQPAPAASVQGFGETAATSPVRSEAGEDDARAPQSRYDVKKAFGAIARIHTGRQELSQRQQDTLRAFIGRYVARTPKSKAYTEEHRPHMADPRVVSGFRPPVKEMVYQTVMARSKGARLWDIDGNEYVDANNGFGMSLFGWQPAFVLAAVRKQLDLGYEIGPQHPLAGEVCKLVCEFTGHDRAGLCNTGSEAVLGAMRVARTVTGRSLIVTFNGSYHGINDEVVIRGNKKMQAMPGAPGILRAACENMVVLDYGTPEALQVIRERAHELAAVLVEPVQSRNPDLQPVDFLREVRAITEASGAVLIFDEVITGFRMHPGGAQAMFGIKADLATYGKVIGAGFPLGVIAGKRQYMDALDGGQWNYGDDSVPEVGVTYFAGTFVRHPLALAATKAALEHLKIEGPQLQEKLNARVTAFADDLNAFCESVGAPIRIKHFGSLWRTHWLEDHPMQDLLFAMIRSRDVHILDNFPCYFTTAHEEADFQAVAQAYKDSVRELQDGEFIPRSIAAPAVHDDAPVMDADRPPVPGARLGREPDGTPAWFVPDAARPGKYLKVAG